MDTEMAASRRMKVVAGHFSPSTDELRPPPHTAASACLLPMNCSSNVLLKTVMPPRRCDNRTYFARQSSSSQSFFMRQQQAPVRKQDRPVQSVNETPSSSPLFSRPRSAAAADPKFCRQQAAAPPHSTHSSRIYELPEHSRPCSSSPVPSLLLPEFAKPAATIADGCRRSTRAKQSLSTAEANCSSRSSGSGWSPKMDVSESAGYFLVTVEIPGGDIRDMRVEVDDHNLRIMGKKSLPAMAEPTYHKREILQGPYQIMWPLPCCSNKDSVSAEFVNGLLHITVPKL